MFMNVAYLNNSTSTVVDNTKPLIVTSCGNYRVKNRSEVVTHRPKGRKDYQLLYIASGKGHFFIHGEEKTVSAGNIIIYLPDQPQGASWYATKRGYDASKGFVRSENCRENIVLTTGKGDIQKASGEIVFYRAKA